MLRLHTRPARVARVRTGHRRIAVEHSRQDVSRDCSIEIARTPEEVSTLRWMWQEMECHPYADIDFFLMIVDSRPEIVRPHVMVLSCDGHPQAILVGRIEEKPFDIKIGYKTLFQINARILTTVYEARLGKASASFDAAFVAELVKCLKQGEADVVLLDHLLPDSSLYRCATMNPGILSRDLSPVTSTHRAMRLPGTTQALYQGFSPHLRRQARKIAKRLMNEFNGRVRIECFREPDTVDCMIQIIEQIAAKTYQRALGVGFTDNLEIRRRMHFASGRGWLRTYVLYLEDRPCAFWIGTLYKTTFYSEFQGYDPSYANYSLGNFVTMKTLEALCFEGATQIDHGFGDAHYKRRFGDREWQEASVCIFAPTFKGATLSLLSSTTATMKRTAQAILTRVGVLERTKRIWRKAIREDLPTGD